MGCFFMKTKIFVCSSSGLNELKHSNNIEVIPFLYKFSDDELFEDVLEMSSETAYNKIRYDKSSELELLSISYKRISEYLQQAIKDGYENAFFIMANRAVINLQIPISIAVEDNKNINVILYQSNETSIPLAYIALYAEKRLEEGESLIDVWNELVSLENTSNIFIFKPRIKKMSDFENQFKNGTYQIFKGGRLLETPDARIINGLETMIEEFKDEIYGKKVIPFILTSDKFSKYNEIILRIIKELDDEENKKALEKVRIFSLPLFFGLKSGIDTIAIGYIEAKNGLIIEKK